MEKAGERHFHRGGREMVGYKRYVGEMGNLDRGSLPGRRREGQ